MRFVLPVLICFGITVICVQARKQCRARGPTNTAPATSNFRPFLAVLPATTAKPAAAKPKVVAKATVKPKVVAKAGPACPVASPPWYLTYIFGKARCVGMQNIPKTTRHPIDLASVCHRKDRRSKPMSFHNGAQLTWCKNTVFGCQGGITGMYVIPGRPFQKQWLRNHDLEPADIPWKVGSPGNPHLIGFQIVAPNVVSVDWNWYISEGKANVVCAFWL